MCLLVGAAVEGAGSGRVWAAEAVDETVSQLEALAEMDLEGLTKAKVETVYAASRHEQALSRAPSSVSIITREDFQQFGYRSLADALRSVRGFYVTGDRAYNYVGLRGLNRPGDYGGGVLMMIDGHRLNDPVADQAFSGGEFPLDVDLIDHVEIVRGPGSVMYGNNALFTVIDVVTRKPGDVGLEGSASAGSLDTFAGRFSGGQVLTNGLEVMVSGSLLESRGHERLWYPEFVSENNGWAEDLDREQRKSAFLKLGYRGLSLRAGMAYREKSLPAAPYDTEFNIGPNEVIDERGWLELGYRNDPAAEWRLTSSLYFDHYKYIGFAPYEGTDVGLPSVTVFNRDRSLTRWWGGGVQVSRELSEHHLLTAGLEGRHNAQVDQDNFYVDPPVVLNAVHEDNFNLGAYVQDEWSIRTNLVLTAGARVDYFSTFGETVNPRAAAIWSPFRTSTFKLLYGQAYRAPNGYEFDYEAVGYLSNRELRPETFRSMEFVWEQRLDEVFGLTGTLFRNQIEDQIVQVDESANPAVGGYIFRNLGEAEIRGGEVGLEARWPVGVRARVGYTYAEARDAETGARLSNAPEHLLQANVVVPVYRNHVFAGLDLQAVSRRKSAVSDDFTGGYCVANFTLFSRELVQGLEVSASIYNLFDRRYSDPMGPDFTQQFLEQDGRMFRVKATYRY